MKLIWLVTYQLETVNRDTIAGLEQHKPLKIIVQLEATVQQHLQFLPLAQLERFLMSLMQLVMVYVGFVPRDFIAMKQL